eukprot:3929078-Ditylum_brightwellii.AAC.1
MKWKNTHHAHFHMLNPNGISLADKALALKLLCEYIIEQNNTDYMGFMEINLDTMCGNLTRMIHDTVKKYFSHSKITTASSCIPVNHFFKPGGTMSIIQG